MGPINEAFGFVNNHKKLVLGAAAAYGLISSHVFKDAIPNISDALFDDPNAIHGMGRAVISGGAQSALGAIGVQSQWSGLQPGMSSVAHEDTANYYRGPNPNPDGSIVFGMYNNRLK